MNDFITKMADDVFRSVKTFLEAKTAPLVTRLDLLERREIPVAEVGLAGRDGVDGKDGERGLAGDRGEDGTPGRDGRDGVDGASGKDGEIGPKGADGRDGVDGERGLDGSKGLDGRDGIDGKDGVDGSVGERGEPGEKGINGTDGRDGRDGEPGLDGFCPDISMGIDFERSYPRGTFASFKGGLWRAGEKTSGEKGWDCIVRGIDDVVFEQDEDDYRKQVIRIVLSDGVKAIAPRNDSLAWFGDYKAGDECTRGDIVVFGGSAWVANTLTTATPGTDSKDWKIFARRGRDGKDGEKGLKGDEGRPGRDFRPLGP